MDPALASLLIFAATYFGVALGAFPGLALDRTGVALLGAIAMVVAGRSYPQIPGFTTDAQATGLVASTADCAILTPET